MKHLTAVLVCLGIWGSLLAHGAPGTIESAMSGGSPAQPVLVARSPEGRTAWAVVREWGASVTEVWMAEKGAEPRRVRVFPGRPAGIAWEGPRLVYADRGLTLALVAGGSGWSGVEAALAPGGRWAISLSGDEDVPISGSPAHATADTVKEALSAALSSAPGPDIQRALGMTRDGINLASMAYGAAQKGDFREASVFYRQAADLFEKMPTAIKTLNLSKAMCQSYADALRLKGKANGQEMGRAVCGDHLTLIGEMLKDFSSSFGGRYPRDLVTLKRWVEQRAGIPPGYRGGVVELVFRSPVDRDTERVVSFGYRAPRAGDGEGAAVAWAYLWKGRGVELVKSGGEFRVIDRALGPSQVDSLLQVGIRSMEVDSPSVAVEALDAVTRVAPDLIQGYVKLGYACLKANQIDRAQKAFWKAMSMDGRLAEAYHGMGMAFTKKPKGLYDAIRYFTEAIKLNPRYVEARYHLAEARMKMEEYDALRELERIIAVDSTYAPAYSLIGRWHEEMKGDYEKAALWYTKY